MIESEDLYSEEIEDFTEEHEDNAEVQPSAPADDERGDDQDESSKVPVKPKRVIRNPQPKLNAETLKGKRGLTALPSYFEQVKYKGKGHEEEDLSAILKTYEYWCHRLFPKYPFDDCISKIEALGTKRAVVTEVKRIRFDLLLPDLPPENNTNDDIPMDIPESDYIEPETSGGVFSEPVLHNNDFDSLLPTMESISQISEEQMEQIRINKERALKLRQERLHRKKQLEKSLTENIQTTVDTETSPVSESEEKTEDLDEPETSQALDNQDIEETAIISDLSMDHITNGLIMGDDKSSN